MSNVHKALRNPAGKELDCLSHMSGGSPQRRHAMQDAECYPEQLLRGALGRTYFGKS